MAGRFGPFAQPWVPPQTIPYMTPPKSSATNASTYGLGTGFGWGAPGMQEPLHWHEFTIFDVVQPTPPDLKAMEESIRAGLAAIAGADHLVFTTPARPIPHPHLPWDHYRRPIASLRFAIGKRGAWTDKEKRVVLAQMREGLQVTGVTGMKDWRLKGQKHVEESVGSSSSSSRSGSTNSGSSSVTCSTCYPYGGSDRTNTSSSTRVPLVRKAMKMVPGAEPPNYRVSRWLVKEL